MREQYSRSSAQLSPPCLPSWWSDSGEQSHLVVVNLFTRSFQDACTEKGRVSGVSSTFLTCAGDFIAVRVTALNKEFRFNVVVSVNARIADLVSRTHDKGMVGRWPIAEVKAVRDGYSGFK